MSAREIESSFLYDVTYLDSKRGLAVGWVPVRGSASNGVLLSTLDGGLSWSGETTAAWAPFRAIDFWDERSGWIASDYTGRVRHPLLRTADGGRSWRGTGIALGKDLRAFYFSDIAATGPDSAVVVGHRPGGVASITSDGGVTWKTVVLERDLHVTCVSFADARNGWAAGWYWGDQPSLLFRTRDGGRSWRRVRTPPFRGSPELAAPEPGVVWIASGGSGADDWGLLMTRDGGRSWTRTLDRLADGRRLVAMNLHFSDARSGWVTGIAVRDPYSDMAGAVALRTSDGGLTWSEKPVRTVEWRPPMLYDATLPIRLGAVGPASSGFQVSSPDGARASIVGSVGGTETILNAGP